ncbi:MAG: response regulator, partial [Breznakiellaceae bacterium]
LGYMPVLTSRGEEAVEVLRKSREEGWVFVAAILDLVVPTGMGGKETARILRTLDPNLPLFISSGYSDEDVLADYKNLGFDGIIPKPYNIEELSEILGRKKPE